MAYDQGLAQRIREMLSDRGDVEEKNMFGGLAFMVRGHMTVGVAKDDLMVRCGTDRYQEALALPHAREMDFTKRPLQGFVFVAQDGVADDADLQRWVDMALQFTESLPAK
jgi:TfoX/Sxy family transcriptional regulator of competence genes